VFGVSFGLGTDLLILAAIVIAHDAYFYWAHRIMHHPKLFKHFHRAHHRSITPTPWAAYSFAIPEAAAMFLFVPIWQFFRADTGVGDVRMAQFPDHPQRHGPCRF
jgi:lathosterol oxidase